MFGFTSQTNGKSADRINRNTDIVNQDERADQYTTAVGSYREWSVNVDLGPPLSSVPVPKEDVHIVNYYDALQYSLYENNLPETVDRTLTPQQNFTENNVCIAILSSPVECLAILLEGGVQCPRDMLLVMSCTWVTKKPSKRNSNLWSLYVSKAITFDSGRKTYLDVFDPPRKVTYFVNFFTKAVTDGQRSDGEDLERGLDCPMSSSMNLVQLTDDRVWTRTLAANVKADYPETLAIVYKPKLKYQVNVNADFVILKLDSKTGVENRIHNELCSFLKGDRFRNNHKVVVKPSGVMWHGSLGVTFHDSNDIHGIWTAVLDLLKEISFGESVLVETFYAPPEPDIGSSRNDLSFRIRSTVCRGFGNVPVMTTIICGVGSNKRPINGDNTVPQTLETTLRIWGITDVDEIERLRGLIKSSSENILKEIMTAEENMAVDERGGNGAQTDVIGIDFVLGMKNDVLVPVVIEVNSHDCTINCQLFEFINPKTIGKSVGPLIETMIERSQKYMVEGKVILVVGAGGFSKRFVWPAAQEYNIKVVLVDDEEDCYAARQVHDFLYYDFSDHSQDEVHSKNIIQLLSKNNLSHIEGCCTFWEDNGPLAAIICAKLNLCGPGETAAKIAKKKSWTQETLLERTADIPHFPRTYLYSSKCYHINSTEDIDKGLSKVGLPAVLKLEYGSSAIGVSKIRSNNECRTQYEHIQQKFREEKDHPGIGLGHGNSMTLMEYVKGTEHDVDIIIFQRRLIAAYISDNGPTREGRFTETAASMPTCLADDKSGQMITAAYQCCTEIGLVSGVFNVEMMMTATGPKLVEINARMGGFYLRDWIKACFGVDLLLYVFMISTGIRPILPPAKPRCHIMGIMCVSSAHKKALTNKEILSQINKLRDTNKIRYNPIEEDFESDEEAEEPYCNIAVESCDLNCAKSDLLNVCGRLNLDTDKYCVSDFLQHFVR